jgi:hypothetical protein
MKRDDTTIDNKFASCPKGLHFPERIYLWEVPEVDFSQYCAHCALCGTEYTPQYESIEKREE